MSNLLTKKRIGQAAVFFTCCGLLLAPGMHFLGGRSDPFMRALAQEEFVLEGELVYRGMQTGSVHITEIHKNSDYEIEWPMRTYQYIDGQYYLYDDRYPDAEGFAPIVDISPEEVKPTQEMFERASALSGYTFSDLKYRATERREIPDRTAENMVICDWWMIRSWMNWMNRKRCGFISGTASCMRYSPKGMNASFFMFRVLRGISQSRYSPDGCKKAAIRLV